MRKKKFKQNSPKRENKKTAEIFLYVVYLSSYPPESIFKCYDKFHF